MQIRTDHVNEIRDNRSDSVKPITRHGTNGVVCNNEDSPLLRNRLMNFRVYFPLCVSHVFIWTSSLMLVNGYLMARIPISSMVTVPLD